MSKKCNHNWRKLVWEEIDFYINQSPQYSVYTLGDRVRYCPRCKMVKIYDPSSKKLMYIKPFAKEEEAKKVILR